jgi:predicted dehydrogenase
MKKLNCAVVGVGYIGSIHAEKYASLKEAELVAVVDANSDQAKKVAKRYNCQAIEDYRQLIGQVDAVTIATETTSHFEIAAFFLENNVDVLVEKPMTSTVEQADKLIQLAAEKKRLLQVGHLERFNSAVIALHDIINQPKFFETYRIAPFNLRSNDVNVVLDLMIHDIDLIRYIVDSPIASIVANGTPILSKQIDIANARIQFTNGAVANVTASRAGIKQERKMRIFQQNAYISANLLDRTCSVYRKGDGEMFPGIPDVKRQKLSFPKDDAIKAEIIAFVDSALYQKPSVVSGEAGREALAVSHSISTIIESNYANTDG